jgi:hypothetical protein
MMTAVGDELAQLTPEQASRGGTRFRRSLLLLVPALICTLLLAVAALQGILPLNLAVAGQSFELTSNGAPVQVPQGITMYPSTIKMKDGSSQGVMVAKLPEAKLPKGLCISLSLTFPVLGTWTVRLHTSGSTTAKDMTLDNAGLNAGSATLAPVFGSGGQVTQPVTIGQNAADLPGGNSSLNGRFGIDSPGSGSIDALQSSAEGAIIAGTAQLNGLSVALHHGSGPGKGACF